MKDIKKPSGEAMYRNNIAKQFRACQFRVPIAVGALALGLAFGTAKAQAQTTDTWIANSGTFNVAGNWDTAQVPMDGDTVLFTNNTSYAVNFSANSALLANCTFSGHVGAVSLNMGSSWLYVTNHLNVGLADATATVYMVSGVLYNSDGGSCLTTIGNTSTNSLTCVATMYVTNGTVYSDAVTVGSSGTSIGALVISGTGQWIYDTGNVVGGSQIQSAGALTVGNGAPNCSLIVSNGGTLWVPGSLTVGHGAAGSNNLMLVTGSGTTFSNIISGGLQIGGSQGTYNTMIISNGAHVYTDNGGTIGSSSSHNELIVTGAGSQLIAGETGNKGLIVGTNSGGGTNNALYVYNGGYLSDSGTLAIGNNAPCLSNLFQMGGLGAMSTGNAITLRFTSSGTYGSFILTNAVFSTGLLNFGGTTNSVSILQGGSLIISNSFALLGAGETNNVGFGGSYGTLLINGGTLSSITGSNAAAIGIGGNGTVGNLMIITNSGKMLSEQATISPSSCYVTGIVTGVGSVWSNWTSGASYTNILIFGTNSGGSNDYLAVSDGAGLFQKNDFRIGNSVSAVSNTVSFGGAGASSTVVIGGELFVGAAASFNSVIVTNATVSFGTLQIGIESSTSTSVMDNVLIFSGGTLTGSVVQVRPFNTFDYAAGTLGFTTLQVDGTMLGAATLNVPSGSTLQGDGVIDGPVTVANGGILSPGDTTGTLTISNNLTLAGLSVLNYHLGTNSDSMIVTGQLTLDGTVNVSSSGGFTNSTYVLATYGTLINDGPIVGTLPAGFTAIISNDVPDKQILLVVSASGGSDPFTAWQAQYFTGSPLSSAPGADPLGKGMSNTNQFLAGFNPTNAAAYVHITNISKTNSSTDIRVDYLGASGDSSYSPGFASRTNVLEFTAGTANGSYNSNNFTSTGVSNILSGGMGLGMLTNMVDPGGATNKPSRYYRVRVLVP